MKTYTNFMKEALRSNKERIDTLKAFLASMPKLLELYHIYKDMEETENIWFLPPSCGNDFLLFELALSKKGSISKNIGILIDEIESHTNFRVEEEKVDANAMKKTWILYDRLVSYNYSGRAENPRMQLIVDASKSKICKQVPTGRMLPEYEFICEGD